LRLPRECSGDRRAANAHAVPVVSSGHDRPSARPSLRGLPRAARATAVAMMKRIVCSGLLLLVPATATAQGVRGTATTMARYVEIRPVEHDTIAFDQVEALPDGTFRFDGLPISCI